MRLALLLLSLAIIPMASGTEPRVVTKSRKQLLQEHNPVPVNIRQMTCQQYTSAMCEHRQNQIASARIRANPGYGQAYGFKVVRKSKETQ